MKKLLIFTLLNCLFLALLLGQEQAYQIYNKDGNKISYKTMAFEAKRRM
jgi:hypothetical protein